MAAPKEVTQALIQSTHEEKKITNELSWKNRPDSVKNSIGYTFKDLSLQNKSNWGLFNGSSSYEIAGIDTTMLVEKVCQELSRKGEKEFYFLDIGAGNFGCGRNVAHFINHNRGLFPNLQRAHIISIRGESNYESPIHETGICTLYNFGSFKVEELESEFSKVVPELQLDTGKIDLIVSSWCFRHLVDPTGTFVQVYDLLKPQSGILLVDGFFLSIDDHSFENHYLNNLKRIVCPKGSQTIIDLDDTGTRRAFGFIIKRNGVQKCELPLAYDVKHGLSMGIEHYQIGSQCVTNFKSLSMHPVIPETNQSQDERYILLGKDVKELYASLLPLLKATWRERLYHDRKETFLHQPLYRAHLKKGIRKSATSDKLPQFKRFSSSSSEPSLFFPPLAHPSPKSSNDAKGC